MPKPPDPNTCTFPILLFTSPGLEEYVIEELQNRVGNWDPIEKYSQLKPGTVRYTPPDKKLPKFQEAIDGLRSVSGLGLEISQPFFPNMNKYQAAVTALRRLRTWPYLEKEKRFSVHFQGNTSREVGRQWQGAFKRAGVTAGFSLNLREYELKLKVHSLGKKQIIYWDWEIAPSFLEAFEAHPSSLNPTLAYAMWRELTLLLPKHFQEKTLEVWNPFCGHGTLSIMGAMLKRKIQRETEWEINSLIATDQDPAFLEKAMANASQYHVQENISWQEKDFLDTDEADWDRYSCIVANPPFDFSVPHPEAEKVHHHLLKATQHVVQKGGMAAVITPHSEWIESPIAFQTMGSKIQPLRQGRNRTQIYYFFQDS